MPERGWRQTCAPWRPLWPGISREPKTHPRPKVCIFKVLARGFLSHSHTPGHSAAPLDTPGSRTRHWRWPWPERTGIISYPVLSWSLLLPFSCPGIPQVVFAHSSSPPPPICDPAGPVVSPGNWKENKTVKRQFPSPGLPLASPYLTEVIGLKPVPTEDGLEHSPGRESAKAGPGGQAPRWPPQTPSLGPPHTLERSEML